MPQLSLFSAEARPPRVADLAGLLCGPGQVARFGAGDQARMSIVLADPSRADALRAACSAAGVELSGVRTDSGSTALRSAFRCDLVGLATAWTHGAVKAVPREWQMDGAVLRMWALAAGRPDEHGGYLLALDQHAPQTHLSLIAAVTRLGIPPSRAARGTALRIGGARRMARLVELVGAPPARLAPEGWPRVWGRVRT